MVLRLSFIETIVEWALDDFVTTVLSEIMTWNAIWLSIFAGLGLAACATPTPTPPATPPVAAPVAVEPEPTTLAELLAGIEAAYRKGDYNRGLALVKRVYEMKQADVTTLDRVGSVYYVLGRYGEALTVWQQALPLEKNLRRRRELSQSITVARQTLGLGPEGQPAPRTAVKPKKPTAGRVAPSKEVLERLYQSGVKHYAAGEYLQATTIFLRIAALDPGNPKAAKALERLHLEGAAPAGAGR